MTKRLVVVDGSNLATEGRSLPSLAQLDTAVREYIVENPDDIVTVVVDASFGHRIEAPEREVFEAAEAAGEITSPPAGAIGRGDAFLLRIAEKTGATVLSNDSFQEFHGEHEWLFDPGRLIGGKPVPGVGWIFTPRTPVRGPKSREAVREAKRQRLSEADAAGTTGLDMVAQRVKSRGKRVEAAIAKATEEVVQPSSSARRRRRTGEAPSEPVNEPLAFIKFIASHPLGSEVTGTVAAFSSHGAFIDADGARCYLPLSAMGSPPPRSAREVLNKGEEKAFVVQALDPLRRGVELALPGFAMPAGEPTAETVEAEISPRIVEDEEAAPEPKPRTRRRRRGGSHAAAPDVQQEEPLVLALPGPSDAPGGVADVPAAPKPRSRRRPAAPAASPAAPPPEVAAAAAPAPQAEVTPSPKPRTRRRSGAAAGSVEAPPAAASPPLEPETAAAPPKPRSRRRPAAAASTTAPAPAPSPPEVEVGPPPKPRTRRKPASQVAPETAADPAVPATPPESEVKAAPRPRTRRKPSPAAAGAPSEPADPPPPPPPAQDGATPARGFRIRRSPART